LNGDQNRLRIARCAVVGAGVAVASLVALFESARPDALTVACFAAVLLLAENTAILLPSVVTVSPGSMLVMAAVAALQGEGAVLGACIVGSCGGLVVAQLRERKFGTVAMNCAQYLMASAAAAAVYGLAGGGRGPGALLGALLAVAAFATVNVGLVLPGVALVHRKTPAHVWADMRPALPNFLAFGVLGVLIGLLYLAVGPLALPLLLTPAMIARITYASYLRLRDAHEAAIRVFVSAIDAKDRYTAGHSERVARYADYIAEELGLTPDRREHLRYAALMHDVGKLAVPARLLNKPDRLTADEYAQIRRHNDVCIQILTRVEFLASTVAAASDAHAHYDPLQPIDEAVMEGYIVAVADAFDAMTSTRSYRRALSQTVAFAELRRQAGAQFHPECADALIRAIERRGERYGHGYEREVVQFDVAPPVVGLGSAGLGDLLPEREVVIA
jgi:HD domain-containing protein